MTADIAIGMTCSDGTLVAVCGKFTDAVLTGTCPVCKRVLEKPNPSYFPADEQVVEEAPAEMPEEAPKLFVVSPSDEQVVPALAEKDETHA